MVSETRLWSLAASLAGTLGQLGVIAATAPAWFECGSSLCRYGGGAGPVELSVAWEPYIDNAGAGVQPSRERRCPGPQSAGSGFWLDHAPLPSGFDVHAYPEGDVLACVRLSSDGSVEAVRMVAGTGRAGLDERLLRTIYRRWRFRPVDGVDAGHSWQRVRLNSGYGSGPLMEIAPLPR